MNSASSASSSSALVTAVASYQSQQLRSPVLRWFSKLLVCAVAFLIFLGGHVKSNEAGLAVPDWPTSFGYNMFTFPVSYWVGGIFHEHVHRLVASGVGFLTLVLMVWTLFVETRRSVRILTAVALVAVMVQGLLGGLTVLFHLPVWTSSLHGTLGQVFFCLVVAIAYTHSKEWASAASVTTPSAQITAVNALRRAARVLAVVIFLQLIFGNLMRHSEAGLAVPDFPTMGGAYLPSLSAATMERINELRTALRLAPVVEMQVLVHLIHRLWAVGILAVVLWVGLALRRVSAAPFRLKYTMRAIELLIVVQVALGVWVILSGRIPLVATAHVLVGALLLAASVLLNLRAGRLL